jgi:hypothetical protein
MLQETVLTPGHAMVQIGLVPDNVVVSGGG